MIRLPKFLFVALISLVTLVGCTTTSTDQASTETSPADNPPASVVSAPEEIPTQGVDSLVVAVNKTKEAVEAGNFEIAKKEFQGFDETWGKLEGEIKAKSSDGYESIEKTMDEISAALKESTPNKDLVLEKLESLSKQITTIPQ
ncbi:MAG: DUF4363 domain-containing protein [Nostocaceae cyanobacterium]|nr:DUF4363 domain-containing protein [Nostocaceae cyanobacterium]